MTAKRRGGRKPPPSRREEFLARVRRELFFLDWAEVLFVSAKTGERVRDLFRVVDAVQRERTRRVETPRLNQLLRRALESYPPPRVGGKRLHILYAVQKPVTPPTFLLFVNDPACRSPHYERHLVDQLRATWGFGGCPVRLEWRGREPRERERRRKFTRK